MIIGLFVSLSVWLSGRAACEVAWIVVFSLPFFFLIKSEKPRN